jgi:CheY-like chemotaxis protein
MPTSKLTSVLYVDDDPDICEVVHASLSLVAGLTVQTAGSGERALVLAPVLRPDLILMDVMMPGLDGPSTLRRMRAGSTPCTIPVIFLTAKVLPSEIAEFRELGTIGVIGKPFNPLRLGEEVIALWEQNEVTRSRATLQAAIPLVQTRVASIVERYLERAKRDVVHLLEMIERAADGDRTALGDVARLAHSFHGAGALFGFPALSVSGGVIERLIEEVTGAASGVVPAFQPGTMRRLLYRGRRLAKEVEAAGTQTQEKAGMLCDRP